MALDFPFYYVFNPYCPGKGYTHGFRILMGPYLLGFYLGSVWETVPLPCILPKACFEFHSQTCFLKAKEFTNHNFFFLPLGIASSKNAFCLPNEIPNEHLILKLHWGLAFLMYQIKLHTRRCIKIK